jgi:hypothetical protein
MHLCEITRAGTLFLQFFECREYAVSDHWLTGSLITDH